MQADYAAYARANDVVDMPRGYDAQHQAARNALMAQVGYYWWALLMVAAALIAAIWFSVRVLMRKR